jgi:hypothetical protein
MKQRRPALLGQRARRQLSRCPHGKQVHQQKQTDLASHESVNNRVCNGSLFSLAPEEGGQPARLLLRLFLLKFL